MASVKFGICRCVNYQVVHICCQLQLYARKFYRFPFIIGSDIVYTVERHFSTFNTIGNNNFNNYC